MVTGSYIRRTNSESPSPVTTIDADEISKSGLNSIADVINTVSADNSGTLAQAFSGAMAGGADGVALRGLSVDATLVLVDGHRMASYPLSDDGQRQFVDISSLPMAIVDRVEVLKDGASATYGSDAIAGRGQRHIKEGIHRARVLGRAPARPIAATACRSASRRSGVRATSMPTATISMSVSKAGISRRSLNWRAALMYRLPT